MRRRRTRLWRRDFGFSAGVASAPPFAGFRLRVSCGGIHHRRPDFREVPDKHGTAARRQPGAKPRNPDFVDSVDCVDRPPGGGAADGRKLPLNRIARGGRLGDVAARCRDGTKPTPPREKPTMAKTKNETAAETPIKAAISEMTDASLEKMVEGICDHYGEWLDNVYRWPNRPNSCKAKDEQKTVRLFDEYSKLLREGKIEDSIAGIFEWGGARKTKHVKQEQTDFANAIQKLNHEGNVDLDAILDTILDLGNNPKTHSSRIAFWSKVLAAYKPGKYYIYDSRVAIALSYISRKLALPDVWRIPPNSKKCKGICHFSNHSNPCYRRYLELLRRLAKKEKIKGRYDGLSPEIKDAYDKMFDMFQDQNERKQKSIMAHLEKMLFMMKDKICGDCRLC